MDLLYFQCNKEYYQQINGLPMGLSVSPIIANIVLQDLEEEFLQRYNKSIILYGRYVDDSFIIIAKNKLKLLLKFLNSYRPLLQFTHEIEKYNSISFLDVSVIKNPVTSIP